LAQTFDILSNTLQKPCLLDLPQVGSLQFDYTGVDFFDLHMASADREYSNLVEALATPGYDIANAQDPEFAMDEQHRKYWLHLARVRFNFLQRCSETLKFEHV